MLAGIIGSLAVDGVVGAPTPVAVVVFGAVAIGITGHALLVDAPGDLAEEADDADPEKPPLVE